MHSMRAVLGTYAARALLVLCVCTAAGAQEEAGETVKVRATGHSSGQGLQARRDALEAASRDALAQYLNTLVVREDLLDITSLMRQAPAFIERVELLRHDETKAGSRIEADVWLRERVIFRAAAEAIELPEDAPPEVRVVIGEQYPRDSAPAVLPEGVVEEVLCTYLENAGMRAEGVESAEPYFDHPALVQIVRGDREVASEFARTAGVDVVVVGDARVELVEAAAGSNVVRHEAHLVLRFFRGANGKMTDSLQETQVVHGVPGTAGARQALEDVAHRLAEPVRVAAVVTYLGTEPPQGVRIIVEDPGPRTRIDALAAHIERAPGMGSASDITYEPAIARIDLDYAGPLAPLVDHLELCRVDEERLVIQRAVPGEIRVTWGG
ncbi:MAG: hypothetical protein ACLFTT_13075 [Candidatus Hydrogenedentota bacterium]